jgi:peroxiredoxin Q/BCP|tara:strand:- start:445 stop:696 length:252 start_codon:yes stop_codon:yes gene_type:complete
VSADSIQKNKNFKEKQEFQYELLSDENKTMIESYGAWVKKKMYGKEYMGIARISYLIDKDGIVSHVFDKVKTKSHALDVLNNL